MSSLRVESPVDARDRSSTRRLPDRGNEQPFGDELLDLAKAIHEAAMVPGKRVEVLQASACTLASALPVPLTAEEFDWLEQVLENAKAGCRFASDSEDHEGSIAAALEAANVGVICVDANGRIEHLNRVAARLRDANQSSFNTGLGHALAAAVQNGESLGTVVSRVRLSATSVLEFRSIPETPSSVASFMVAKRRAFTVEELSTERTVPPAAIADALGLTPAEARLCAALARGLSVGQAANALGVKVTTVRTQLRSVFAKTETANQSQLMRVLLRVGASIVLPLLALG